MPRWVMKRCWKCKSERLERATAEIDRVIGGCTFKATIPCTRCPKCEEEVYAGGDLAAFDLAVAGELAGLELSTPDAFKFMHGALELTSVELAELLDVSPETISRWEHGKCPIDSRANALVSGMVLDAMEGSRKTMDRLRARRRASKVPTEIRLDLHHNGG
jgi:hypothetical protein